MLRVRHFGEQFGLVPDNTSYTGRRTRKETSMTADTLSLLSILIWQIAVGRELVARFSACH